MVASTTLTSCPLRPQIPAGIKTPLKAFVFANLLVNHPNRPFNKILFHSDNQSICLAWENAQTSKSDSLRLMHDIMMLAATNNFNVTIKHIAGIDNTIADALSRLQMCRFYSLAPYTAAVSCVFPSFDHLQILFQQLLFISSVFCSRKVSFLLYLVSTSPCSKLRPDYLTDSNWRSHVRTP